MPAPAPTIGRVVASHLAAIGEALRSHRRALKVSATTTAEAAGVSRTTLHRIERGEPSVTMGAYLNAVTALGLELRVVDPNASPSPPDGPLPAELRIGDYPELSKLAWQRGVDATVTPKEALDLYERNWRHLDRAALTEAERGLLERLIRVFGKGRPLV